MRSPRGRWALIQYDCPYKDGGWDTDMLTGERRASVERPGWRVGAKPRTPPAAGHRRWGRALGQVPVWHLGLGLWPPGL